MSVVLEEEREIDKRKLFVIVFFVVVFVVLVVLAYYAWLNLPVAEEPSDEIGPHFCPAILRIK